MIEIVQPGGLATVQDLGRFGYAHLGVGRSGAADRGALRLANRLLGNTAGAAAVEVSFGGLIVVLHQAATVVLTGAHCPSRLEWGVATTLPAGARIALGTPAKGLRSYLAVRGGISVPAVLGSRSTDILGGLGPPPLRAGDVLPIGDDVEAAVVGAPAIASPSRSRVRIFPGPRQDWFGEDTLALLTATAWTVGADSNRIGIRLNGPSLIRVRDGELPSEPTLPGALQVPPDGQPIVLGPDAPVTGGYPVIAVVGEDDLDVIGQLRPGEQLRMESVTLR